MKTWKTYKPYFMNSKSSDYPDCPNFYNNNFKSSDKADLAWFNSRPDNLRKCSICGNKCFKYELQQIEPPICKKCK